MQQQGGESHTEKPNQNQGYSAKAHCTGKPAIHLVTLRKTEKDFSRLSATEKDARKTHFTNRTKKPNQITSSQRR